MGRTSRRKPKRLGEKLLHIRQSLGMSQNQLIRRLGFEELVQGTISAFESGAREPSLLVLLAYARAANVSVESLIDDALDLPDEPAARVGKAKGTNRFGRKSVSKN